MDGWDIADALLAGREFPRAKLRTISTYGDGADLLYVWLFEVTVASHGGVNVFDAIRTICAHKPTAEAWVHVVRYAVQPTGQNYAKLAIAARKMDDTARTIMRLAPLALIRAHRRRFARLIEHVSETVPDLRADLAEVAADLKQAPGPARLQTKRRNRPSANGS
ncbi:MAG: hypothetical protein H7312_24760 [Tardiphaga sp.]|nr:hypothetical protein [Tardiphaga sp.]